ncbi:hypothetical protein [Mycolicibacterium fortuitum]|uniref:hypothetical protein n=1 Tax=Mycolicibacterium fortuitum TaxID=1766 RepID=UPI000A67FE4B|nr:hypothetical protein [Mycolicibacterium fortuitum]
MFAAPKPSDPLDDLIARFVTAVNEFLTTKAHVDPPPPKQNTGNPWDDLQRNWEEFKRHIRRCYEALVGAQPEVAQRLDVIVSLGCEIKALTDDPNITNPVDGVVVRATDERAEVGNIIPRMANATSFPTVMSLIGELLGLGTRTVARRKEIHAQLDALTAYYILGMPPQGPAA